MNVGQRKKLVDGIPIVKLTETKRMPICDKTEGNQVF